ncbi:MAG: hypothetical protein HFJ54_02795 [Clostridia bacterium]|nr:hypothetical protein [Clostridia bacterium]
MFESGIKGVISGNITFSDIETNTARENMTFEMNLENNQGNKEEKMSYKYALNMNKNFLDTVNIDPLTTQNTVILNDTDEQYRKRLIEALNSKIKDVNRSQMAELELREDENPLIYATPVGYLMFEKSNIIKQIVGDNDKYEQAKKQEEEVANEIMKNLDDVLKESFNSKFWPFQGQQNGSTTKSLLSTVISNNISNEIKVSVNGMRDQYKLTNYMNNIENKNNYNINIITNEYGYISEIQIK